jgi:hypothetical protein
MAREVFSRRSNRATTRTLTVSTENVAHRVLVDPGDYPARISKAQLIEPRRDGNISVVLELVHPESNDYFDVRPLWIAGPNAGNGNMAGRNLGIVRDLLEVIGIPPSSYKELNDELLVRLVGRVFELTLDLDRGGRGGVFNTVIRVNGTIDPADVVEFPNPAAD